MNIDETVRKVVAEHAGRNDFPDDICLGGQPWERKGLDLDSLDRIGIALKLEEAFGIEIPDDDIDRPETGTPAGLIAYITARLGLTRSEAA